MDKISNDETRTGETSRFDIVVSFDPAKPWEPDVQVPAGVSAPMLYAAAGALSFLADVNMSSVVAASQRQTAERQIETARTIPFLPRRKGN